MTTRFAPLPCGLGLALWSTIALAGPTIDQVLSHANAVHSRAELRPAMRSQPTFIEGMLLVKLKPSAAAAKSRTVFLHENRFELIQDIPALGTMAVRLAPSDRVIDAIDRLRQDPRVEYAEPNWVRYAATTPNDQHYGFQWHYHRKIWNLEQAWDETTGSSSITLGVVDSGFRYDHPDLGPRMDQTNDFDFVDCTGGFCDDENDDTPGPDGDATDPGPPAPDNRGISHGTHVAGTVGAVTNNGTGVAGVVWTGQIVGARVLGGRGTGSTLDVVNGLLHVGGLETGIAPKNTNPAKVINLSVAGPGDCSGTESDAISRLFDAGVIVVVAAGNSNAAVESPANCSRSIAVGAIDQTGNKASYSNFGPTLDVMAPGGDMTVDLDGDGYGDGVLSTSIDFSTGQLGYFFSDGTSMAAPHATGIVALMMAKGVPAAEIQQALRKTATDLGTSGRDDQTGYGLIDPVAAINYQGGGGDDGDGDNGGGGGGGCFGGAGGGHSLGDLLALLVGLGFVAISSGRGRRQV